MLCRPFPEVFSCIVTGAVVTDFDGDGRLELLISHGESAAQPLSVYKVNQVSVCGTFKKPQNQRDSQRSVIFTIILPLLIPSAS